MYQLKRIDLETQRYPSRKFEKYEMGFYSTLENAYKIMQEDVAEAKQEMAEWEKEKDERVKKEEWPELQYNTTFGYTISELRLDTSLWYWGSLSDRTYTRDGELNDECFWEGEKESEPLPFYGRPEEKIRFKVGDIVEVIGRGEVDLRIIGGLPWTPQKIEERNIELKKEYGKGHELHCDSSDDCYLSHSLGIGNTHDHPACTLVFAPTKKVPLTIKRKLQAKYIEETITFGYNRSISEQPFAKDPKVLDELLNGWDKFINTQYYQGMECLVDYSKPEEVKAQLNFSAEQAHRFDHFYETCVRMVNEKRGKEKETHKS